MTPHVYSPLGVFEPIFLIILILMLFVGLAGGNPGMVLQPVFEIFGQLLGAFISLLCVAVSTVIRLGLSAVLSAMQKLLHGLQDSANRNINR